MVLCLGKGAKCRFIEENEIVDPELIYKNFPEYVRDSQQLVKLPETRLGAPGVLYVNQREFAATVPEDEMTKYIGTDSATTCNIVCLRHTGSRAVCLSHLDGSNTEEAVASMIMSTQALTNPKDDSLGRLEIHLIGGFKDEQDCSREVTEGILRACVKRSEKIFLRGLCILGQNTEYFANRPRPILYGIAVELHGGYCFPAKFMYKGPDIPLRTARLFRGTGDCLNIYDYQNHELQIGPFDYKAWPNADKYYLLPDALIRQYLSTSPSVEKPDFAHGTKAAIKIIMEHPDPLKTIFDEKPRKYKRKTDGFWELLDNSNTPGTS
ncbi:unnamed protein product [Oikopleura dioica]|uniref:Protein N-terminal asparagine amidohydrolase n=1 Tax=Oikopleura dioica TaxID=34765 RepID=E4WVX8_OIKDI|nr:unnamed protein product [Oikopleura dioica]CBY33023.1 unnamed protein product [Oikopleura dioica]